MAKDAATRLSTAIQNLRGISRELADQVQGIANAHPPFGDQISLGFGHGVLAGLSAQDQEDLRSLLLCHLALNPEPAIVAHLADIRASFTANRLHLRDAIRSFTSDESWGPHVIAATAESQLAGGALTRLSWRGDGTANLDTCWLYVTSCAFQAGFLSLQKALEIFVLPQAQILGGSLWADRVLMNRVLGDVAYVDGVPRGHVVGFYRGPAGGAATLTHVAISTGAGACRGVRQPQQPIGASTQSIADVAQTMPHGPAEVIHIRSCDPARMERR